MSAFTAHDKTWDTAQTAGYAQRLGARLRQVRQAQGLSLFGVEEKSDGRWKAVVVGSYERGDRAVTVARLAELAAFYGVPTGTLLPEQSPAEVAAERVRRVLSEASAALSDALAVLDGATSEGGEER
jgi:transcriptional regulator with XRE-family HTH domain